MKSQERITNLPQREGGEVEESDQEDVISLCDLLTDQYQVEPEYDSFYHDSNEDNSFEFSFNTEKSGDALGDDTNSNAINFWGKIVSYSADYRQQQVPDSPIYYINNKRKNSNTSATVNHRRRYYARNSRSRSQKVLIGLAKIPTEMELSDIKKRLSKRRNPAPMFPVNPGGGDHELAVAGDNNRYGGRRSQWRLVRSLRCGAQFASLLAKSAFGCFSLVEACHY